MLRYVKCTQKTWICSGLSGNIGDTRELREIWGKKLSVSLRTIRARAASKDAGYSFPLCRRNQPCSRLAYFVKGELRSAISRLAHNVKRASQLTFPIELLLCTHVNHLDHKSKMVMQEPLVTSYERTCHKHYKYKSQDCYSTQTAVTHQSSRMRYKSGFPHYQHNTMVR